VLRLTRTLQVMVEQISGLQSEIADALDAHPDGGDLPQLLSLAGLGVICAATLLGGDR